MTAFSLSRVLPRTPFTALSRSTRDRHVASMRYEDLPLGYEDDERDSDRGSSAAASTGSSSLPPTDSLNSRIPFPSYRPISGRRLGPKTRSTTRSKIRSSQMPISNGIVKAYSPAARSPGVGQVSVYACPVCAGWWRMGRRGHAPVSLLRSRHPTPTVCRELARQPAPHPFSTTLRKLGKRRRRLAPRRADLAAGRTASRCHSISASGSFLSCSSWCSLSLDLSASLRWADSSGRGMREFKESVGGKRRRASRRRRGTATVRITLVVLVAEREILVAHRGDVTVARAPRERREWGSREHPARG